MTSSHFLNNHHWIALLQTFFLECQRSEVYQEGIHIGLGGSNNQVALFDIEGQSFFLIRRTDLAPLAQFRSYPSHFLTHFPSIDQVIAQTFDIHGASFMDDPFTPPGPHVSYSHS